MLTIVNSIIYNPEAIDQKPDGLAGYFVLSVSKVAEV